MRRAIDLAERGRGRTRPNPIVGAVVVRGGRIVGEGWHARLGDRHAEVMALDRAGRRARGATMFVTLEPCAHTGRTPPCVDALIRAGIRRCVVALRDPNPIVDGRGLARLRRASHTRRSGWIFTPGRRAVRRGSSAATVPAPTTTTSARARSVCAKRRAIVEVIQRERPPASAILPSSVAAIFQVTRGRRFAYTLR